MQKRKQYVTTAVTKPNEHSHTLRRMYYSFGWRIYGKSI